MEQWTVGIDEAGRGPLAGPVAIGVACIKEEFDWELLPGVGDSKKVSPKNREAIFRRAYVLKKEGVLDYHVSMVGATTIDRIGIAQAVDRGIVRALGVLASRIGFDEQSVSIKLDGLLHAPAQFVFQETIVKGDAKEKVIGLASIMAKVTRDRYMERLADNEHFAPYGFAVHKGYGTKAHQQAIRTNGLCTLHRKSFCRKLIGS